MDSAFDTGYLTTIVMVILTVVVCYFISTSRIEDYVTESDSDDSSDDEEENQDQEPEPKMNTYLIKPLTKIIVKQ